MTSSEMESPFTPGRPVDPRLFVGREAQVQQLLDTAKKARRGSFQIAYVSGERGIGKSSLVKMALHIAATQHNAVVAHAQLGGVSDFAGLGRRAMEATVQDSVIRPWGADLLKSLGDRVERVGMMGVDFSLKAPERDFAATGENLPGEMAALLQKIGGKRAPLILALDDINGFADKPEFAHWVKSATENAASRSDVPVFLIFVGLEERRRQMMKHNPSVARVFQPTLFVEPWPKGETRDFFRRGFEAGGIPASLFNKGWLSWCAEHSGGFPMLAQEIGDAVWLRARKGEEIPHINGVFDAANSIGRQHLQSSMMDSLRSFRYKSLLKKATEIAVEKWTGKFSRNDLLNHPDLSKEEKAGLDVFLQRMRKLGAIVADEESAERGNYRFPTMLHMWYFQMAVEDKGKKSGRAK